MSGIFRPIISQPFKHIFNMLTIPEYFNYSLLWSKLRRCKRYTDYRIKIHDWELIIPDYLSFLYSYQEIFLQKIYDFKTENKPPRILDLGANIGLSILYFKSVYPDAKITAFEADPKIFGYLKNNISNNGFSDVELVNKAIWNKNTRIDFMSEGADSGQINPSEGNIQVEAIDIVEVLDQGKFDFLKIDIEGAEEFVIPRCKGLLNNIKFIFIEYHSKVGHEQSLDRILSILKESGFRIYIRNVVQDDFSPFIGTKVQSGFDLQLNIFGTKK